MSGYQVTVTDSDGNLIASAAIEAGGGVYVNTETVEELIPALKTLSRYRVAVVPPGGDPRTAGRPTSTSSSST
ncbi:MAG: hypothetical protein JO345_25850 [Streptosporangiaceae bacterium]|nr:hypothetical protein [Streptosporangiaceae bacterium]